MELIQLTHQPKPAVADADSVVPTAASGTTNDEWDKTTKRTPE